MLDNKAIELWQETNKLLARIASALEARRKPYAPCVGRAKGHNWVPIDAGASWLGYRCTECGLEVT